MLKLPILLNADKRKQIIAKIKEFVDKKFSEVATIKHYNDYTVVEFENYRLIVFPGGCNDVWKRKTNDKQEIYLSIGTLTNFELFILQHGFLVKPGEYEKMEKVLGKIKYIDIYGNIYFEDYILKLPVNVK